MTADELIDRIKAARLACGFSQKIAADKAGVSQPTWHYAENRERAISAETLVKMAAAVGLHVEHVPEQFKLRRK